MQKKSFFTMAIAFTVFAVGLAACGASGKKGFAKAGDYDQYIISRINQMQQTLFAAQKATGNEDSAVNLGKFVQQIDSLTKSLKELPDYKGNTSYRDAAIRLADFYKRSISGSYTEIARVYKEVKDSTLADNRVNELIIKLQEEETLADDAFVKEREAFAAKNQIQPDGELAK
ncbi:hypothetical protein LL912_19310 [Niabella sp. CC-SYL272]|uniref:LIC11966 family surface protein n=1 Tax=Niabella agricola TaxID=2891571 RepID=UPI001F25007A|nr:hypothetical protein [Niabella agricola]MCF3110943.1 hypothetical protein [Niabella agricola]